MAKLCSVSARLAALLVVVLAPYYNGMFAWQNNDVAQGPIAKTRTGSVVDLPMLLLRSRRCAEAPGVAKPGDYNGLPYEWQSDHSIVYWQGRDRIGTKATRVDTFSGDRDELTAFNARLTQDCLPVHTLLSPDGNWVLSIGAVKGSAPAHWCAVSLDGNQEVSGFRSSDSQVPIHGIWMQNSRGWVSLNGMLDSPRAEFRSRDNSRQATTRKLVECIRPKRIGHS
jgi:hypothetical protein